MDINKAFPSKYINAADLAGREFAVTIARVQIETLKSTDGTENAKPVLYFTNAKKGLVLNKTNATAIAAIHGGETDLWAGKEVVLYPSQTVAFGRAQEVVRVRGVTLPAVAGEPTL